jgi:hypothetical protein
VDARLWSINGQRPEALKQTDLPNLARAIVAYMRHLDIAVHAGYVRNTSYVRFQGDKGSFQVLVRGDDWAKIVPYLKDGTFSPPPEPLKPWGEGLASLANIDTYDAPYYQMVLGVLSGLFPQDYPTSYL